MCSPPLLASGFRVIVVTINDEAPSRADGVSCPRTRPGQGVDPTRPWYTGRETNSGLTRGGGAVTRPTHVRASFYLLSLIQALAFDL